jgi:hypothetical protein
MRTHEILPGNKYRLPESPRRFGVHAGQTGTVVTSWLGQGGWRFIWECKNEHTITVRARDLRPVNQKATAS